MTVIFFSQRYKLYIPLSPAQYVKCIFSFKWPYQILFFELKIKLLLKAFSKK